MSQKEEGQAADKWRDIAENADKEPKEAQESVAGVADDAHLLSAASDKKLTDQVNVMEKQIEFLKDQVARSQAELENMRRRMEQEVAKARKFGVERLISDLVPAVDGLSRGLDGVNSNDPQVQLMRQGIELTLGMLGNLLEKNGVAPIDPKAGDVFDPTQHEAMSMQPHPEAKSNTILQVLQKGYALHGRVIRAAMVIVAA